MKRTELEKAQASGLTNLAEYFVPPPAPIATKAEPMELFPVADQPFSLAGEKGKATANDLQARIAAMRRI